MDDNDIEKRYILERNEGWKTWVGEIPYIQWPADWKVKSVPPFGGAMVRYYVKKDDMMVSIYLDVFDRLGFMQKPYWEIYPDSRGDCSRFDLNEVNEMLLEIENSFEIIERRPKNENI